MSVPYHAWTHLPGGTDPLPGLPWCLQTRGSGSVTAGVGTSSDNIILPFHPDQSGFSSSLGEGNFAQTDDGGIWIPSSADKNRAGTFYWEFRVAFSGSGWQSNNFYLNVSKVLDGETFDSVLGSNELFGTTLEHSMDHDGSGLAYTYSRRKPEVQIHGVTAFYSLSSSNLPARLYAHMYSYTSSLTISLQSSEFYLVQLADGSATRNFPTIPV